MRHTSMFMNRLRHWWSRPTGADLAAITRDLEKAIDRVDELERQIDRARREREDHAISDTWQSVNVFPEDIRPWLTIRTPLGFDYPNHYTLTIHSVLQKLMDQTFTCTRCTETTGIRDRIWRPVSSVSVKGDRRVTFYTVCTLCVTPICHAVFDIDWSTKTVNSHTIENRKKT